MQSPGVEKLLKIRQTLGLTQVALAKYLGVTQSAVYYWEKGTTVPRVTAFSKLLLLAKKAKIKLNFEDFAHTEE